jgi:hypothetical protein
MHSTAQINAIIRNAKQQRADYIGAKVQGSALPIALVAALSFALVQFASAGGPSQAQPEQASVAELSAQNG